MSKFTQNYFYTVGVLLSMLIMLRHGVDVGTALFAGGTAIILLGAFRLAQMAEFDDCPRILLGYNCRGNTCDHSPEELARAKAALRQR